MADYRVDPRIDVHVVHAETATLELRELRERDVDLMVGRILGPLDDDIGPEVLLEDRRFVVAGARSRWVGRRKLALPELAYEPWILDRSNAPAIALITTAFRAHGLELPQRNVTSFSLHVRTYLLVTGRFLAILWPRLA